MRPFSPKLSYKLDYATIRTEQGSRLWRLIKRLLEWWIFDTGGKQ